MQLLLSPLWQKNQLNHTIENWDRGAMTYVVRVEGKHHICHCSKVQVFIKCFWGLFVRFVYLLQKINQFSLFACISGSLHIVLRTLTILPNLKCPCATVFNDCECLCSLQLSKRPWNVPYLPLYLTQSRKLNSLVCCLAICRITKTLIMWHCPGSFAVTDK